jgi:hypothetical protein
MTDSPHPTLNSDEPSEDAMDRLWAALDAALDPDPPADPTPAPKEGVAYRCECRRCGYKWNPTRSDDPVTCSLCGSAYWRTPAKTRRGRRPENTDWAAEAERRRKANLDRKRYARLAQVRELAAELGLDITDPRERKPVHRTRRTAKVLREPLPTLSLDGMLADGPNDPAASKPIWPGRNSGAPVSVVPRRTVPPPPGLEDLESQDTKG